MLLLLASIYPNPRHDIYISTADKGVSVMTVNELTKYSTNRVSVSSTDIYLIIKSLAYEYEDSLRLDCIEAIEFDRGLVCISIPRGSLMGSKNIVIDFRSGVVTADGKVYDEPLPRKKSRAVREDFHPSINGFSISNAITMPSEDGYAVYAEVLFNEVSVGQFINKGDGGMCSFRANPPFSTEKIQRVIRTFPGTNRDYGLGPMEVEYDICQMVDSLLEMEGIAKELKKLRNRGRDYIAVDCWKEGKHFTTNVRKDLSDRELDEELSGQLKPMGLNEYEVRRYRGLEDMRVENTAVSEEMLRG